MLGCADALDVSHEVVVKIDNIFKQIRIHEALAAAFEIEITANRENSLVSLFHGFQWLVVTKLAIGRGQPAIGKVAIMREQDAQCLVNPKQVPGAREQVG